MLIILEIIFIVVFLISASMIVYHMVYLPNQNSAMVGDLKSKFLATEIPNQPDIAEQINLSAMQKTYPDIKSWITIEDTAIDYPVLQGNENDQERYIRKNYLGQNDEAGSIFFQWNNDIYESDNLTIYGHNMYNKTMFGILQDYKSREFLDAHKKVYLQKEDGVYEYDIISVMKTDLASFPYQTTNFDESFTKDDYLKMAKELSMYEIETPSSENISQMITLVTCSYENDDSRNVVIAVR